MENAIPSLLIGALLIVASTLMAQSGLKSYDRIGNSLREMESRLSEQSSARLEIQNVTVDGNRQGLTLSLVNTGQTRIAAFEKVDVILTYFTSPTNQLSTWLPYDSSGLGANIWQVTSIAGDNFDPGILNPGESAVIHVALSSAMQAGKTNRIMINNEHGSSASAQFNS
jgi:archaellum component FlaF (FlaF/FlaG flagellin family)